MLGHSNSGMPAYLNPMLKTSSLKASAPLFADIWNFQNFYPWAWTADELGKTGNDHVTNGTFDWRHAGKGNIAFSDGHVEMFSGPQVLGTLNGLNAPNFGYAWDKAIWWMGGQY